MFSVLPLAPLAGRGWREAPGEGPSDKPDVRCQESHTLRSATHWLARVQVTVFEWFAKSRAVARRTLNERPRRPHETNVSHCNRGDSDRRHAARGRCRAGA